MRSDFQTDYTVIVTNEMNFWLVLYSTLPPPFSISRYSLQLLTLTVARARGAPGRAVSGSVRALRAHFNCYNYNLSCLLGFIPRLSRHLRTGRRAADCRKLKGHVR